MKTWKNWFAWYPVAFGPHIKWLTTIQRVYIEESKCWFYRLPPTCGCAEHRVRRGGSLRQEIQKVLNNLVK